MSQATGVLQTSHFNAFLNGVAVIATGICLAPVITVLVLSLTRRQRIGYPHYGESFALYRAALDNAALIEAAGFSIGVALAAAALATAIGTICAFALKASNADDSAAPRLRRLRMLVLLPIGIPEMIQGIAFLMVFSVLGVALGPVTVVLAHTALAAAFVTVVVTAQLDRFDDRLLDAAYDLGASRWRALWLVQLPVLRPALVSGFMLSALLSLDDFILSYFTTSAGFDTLPIKIFSMIRFGVSPEVYALSVMMQVATVVVAMTLLRVVKSWSPITREAQR